MKNSFWNTMKSGNSFIAQHKHIFGGWLIIALVGFLGNFLFNLGYAYIWAHDVEYFLNTLSVSALSAPRISSPEAWSVIQIVLYHFIAELFVAYISICSVVYILSALRNKEVSVIRALKAGVHLVLQAWAVIIGIQIIRFIGLYIIASYPMLENAQQNLGRMGTMALFWIISFLFLVVTFFVYQLVADGSTSFVATIQKSWNYVRASWAPLLGVVILYGILIIVIIFGGGLLALWQPAIASIVMVLGWIGALILSFAYAIAINKIYIQTKAAVGKGHA